MKPFRIEWNSRQNSYQDLPICGYCVQCSYVHLSVNKLCINAFIKRNHLLWNLCFQSVCGKNPTLISSPPKRMGCEVWVSSNFKLKFVSKRSKNVSKKNVGEFFWDLKIALCSNRFFSRDSRSYMYFQLKKLFFLVMSTLFQVGWIKKCPFWQYQFYPSWFKPSSGRDVCFLGTSWRNKLA